MQGDLKSRTINLTTTRRGLLKRLQSEKEWAALWKRI